MRKLPKRYELCVCGHQRLDHNERLMEMTGYNLAICNPCHMRKDKEKAWHSFKLDNLAYIILNAKPKRIRTKRSV